MGNDTLITDDAALKLTEGQGAGYDLVRSSVSYALNDNVENLELLGRHNTNGKGNALANSIEGNSGDNVLSGKGGADTLDGHAGKDILHGGASSDTFVFSTGSGKDVIADFENGLDKIDLQDFHAVSDFADLQAHHLKVSGDDLIIRYGHDSITISNMGKADLDVSDFQF
jgi:Ca2+-binding RTX toxin-like protein